MDVRVFLIVRYSDTRKTIRKWCSNFTVALAELCMLDQDGVTEVKIEVDA